MNSLVSTAEAQNGFYPTPKSVAYQLFDMIDTQAIREVLEPSAGKGDLLRAFGCYKNEKYQESLAEKGVNKKDYNNASCNVDAIEFDPNLRGILNYEFCGQRVQEFNNKMYEISQNRRYLWKEDNYEGLTDEQIAELKQLKEEVKERSTYVHVKIVHNDFMTFASKKHYDLILMNPPFANGDEHLMKAIQMQSENGGKILCILNAETLLNLYSNKRKFLMNTLNDLGAKIQFIDNGFSDAERQTDVRVALIYIDIPEPEHHSEIYEKFQKAKEYRESTGDNSSKLTTTNFLEDLIAQYNEEMELGLALIDEFNALLPYLNRNVVGDAGNYSNLSLKVGNEAVGYTCSPKNKFINLTRHKYWTSLLNNEKFTGMLTKNLKDKYSSMISKFAEYDFTMFNIQALMNDMNSGLRDGIEKTILDLFDKMSAKFAYIPEMESNIHLYNGWKTNKAHKVGKKVILPCNGAFSDWKWDKNPLNVYNCVELLSDMQKALNYLDGGQTDDINLNVAITKARDECNYKKIDTKYFYVTFYKKGTMHCVWKNEELLKRFNIYVSKRRNWFPPCYGNKHYNDMTEEEKQVIDSFQGADDYEKIMRNPSYYLSTNTNLLQLGE